jgi:hypothetical protein
LGTTPPTQRDPSVCSGTAATRPLGTMRKLHRDPSGHIMDGRHRAHRIRGCRSNGPSPVYWQDWADSAGHQRVWFWDVSPNVTVLARRVHRATGEHSNAVFGAQRCATCASVGATCRLCPLFGAEGVGERAPLGIPGRATCVHQGATVFDLRTLAGAKVEVSRVLRAQRASTCVPWRVQWSALRAPFGQTDPIAGLSFGHQGQHGPARSFGQDEPRSRTTFGRSGVTDDRWVPSGLSPNRDPGCSDPARAGHSGQPSMCGRIFERHRSWRKAASGWRGNNRRASGTERCTAPREGKALKGATPRALLA